MWLLVVVVIVAVVMMYKDGFNAEFDTIDILCSVITTIQTYKTNRCRRDTMEDDDDDDDDTIRNRGETKATVISL